MRQSKLFVKAVSVLMVTLVPILLYGFNFNSIAFDMSLYKEEFSKHNVYNNLETYDVEKINGEVLNYLKRGKNKDIIENDFFNEREKRHLLDVRNLVQGVLSIYYFSITLFLLSIMLLSLLMNFNFRDVSRKLLTILAFGSLLAFLGAGLAYLAPSLNFDFAFDAFHKTFFSPGTYLFNPQFEGIVVLYPENLFFDLLFRIIFSIILSSGIIFFISATLFFIFFKRNFPNFSENFPSRKPKNKSFKYYFHHKLNVNFRDLSKTKK